jgi:hypothetical protein
MAKIPGANVREIFRRVAGILDRTAGIFQGRAVIAVEKRLAGQDRSARDELGFVSGQIRRSGKTPTRLQTWALAPSAPQRCSAELLEGIAALSREHELPVLTHVYETRVQASAARQVGSDASDSLLDVLARAGLMNDRLGVVHGVWAGARGGRGGGSFPVLQPREDRCGWRDRRPQGPRCRHDGERRRPAPRRGLQRAMVAADRSKAADSGR